MKESEAHNQENQEHSKTVKIKIQKQQHKTV